MPVPVGGAPASRAFPYAEIAFGADGVVADPAARGVAPAIALAPGVTDLLVMCHGWNNDAVQARSLYDALMASMARVGGAPGGLAVLGAFWPSKQFAAQAADVHAAVVAAIAADPQARADFVGGVRAEVSQAAIASWADPGDQQDMFFGMDPATLFDRLAADTARPIESGVANVLDLATYYEMKARSGLVGSAGMAPLLATLRTARPDLRLHLVGHSFGARVMASALASGGAVPVASATLLQGAFSHFGFARHWDGIHDGLFRPALLGGRVTGPLVVTYSAHDKEVGIAYALASRLAGQADSAFGPIGGPGDRYGAIGANGALATPESLWADMLPVGSGAAYTMTSGAVVNLQSTAYIPSHGAVTGAEPAQALIAAMDSSL